MTASQHAIRDACALMLCSLNGDQEGSDVVKANAVGLAEVAGCLADIVAELFRVHARAPMPDGDPLALLDRVRAGLARRDGA